MVEICCGINSTGGLVAAMSPSIISFATAEIGITHIKLLRLIKLATEETLLTVVATRLDNPCCSNS